MANLVIKNFRALKNAELEVSDFLVVIGEQASGKSTISKLIHYFKSLKKDAIDCLSEHQANNQKSIEDTQKRINIKAQKRFYQLFGSTKKEIFSIVYEYANGKSIKIEQKSSKDSVLNINISFFQTDWYQLVIDYSQFLSKFGLHSNGSSLNSDNIVEIRRKREREEAEKQFSDKINALFGDTDRRRNYIPASRSLISSLASSSGRRNAIDFFSKTNMDAAIDTDVTKYFDVTVGDFFNEIERIKEDILKKKHLSEIVEEANWETKKALEAFHPLLKKILKADYKLVNEREELISNEFAKPVLLEFASSGQQEIVWILLCLFIWTYENYPASVVIEEPEAHLYPKTQDLALQYIVHFFNSNPNNQVIINTHSPYLILALNNLLFAHQVNDDKIIQNTGINKQSWLDPKRFGAYLIENGTVKKIFDKEEGLISESMLEYEATAISDVFEKISDIYQSIN
jgi:predicted ATPase